MTFDEAKAVVQLAGWRVSMWENGDLRRWYIDVIEDGSSDDLVRDSSSRPLKDAKARFIRWVEAGMPDHRNRETQDDFR